MSPPSRLTEFKKDLTALPPRHIVQKHITFGEAAVLSRDQHFELRLAVAKQFRLHPHSVVVVGSAKLGFSIKPTRRYGNFGNSSDIDLALVSPEQFVRYWQAGQAFMDSGGYWEKFNRFRDKFFDGWIRPDLMPNRMSEKWWEFFRQLTASGQYGSYKISAGLYYDWNCLERYQIQAVSECIQETKTP